MPHKTFLTNKINFAKFRVNGLIPSSRLPNKRQLCQSFREHVLYRAEQLPPKVDLRSDMTPVEDQSRIGSCAANSLAGAYEYLTKKANGRNTDVSRLFIYYNARVKDQKSATVVDSGCTMTSAIEALEELGTCLESLWPYDISRVNSRPNDSSYQEANRHKITEALRIDINLNEMKSCLAQGFPFAFGLKLYTSFDQAATTGVVPMPNTADNGRQSHASHALLAVGYSDQSKAFIVRNSWGEQWGDRGYCYIPYEYITNPNLCFDVWTVRKLATDNFGQKHWDVQDVVNYSRVKQNGRVGSNIDDNSGVMASFDVNEDDDGDDYNGSSRKGGLDEPWNPYQSNNGDDYAKYNNDYIDINQDDDYNRNSSSNEPWNSYRAYGGNNYANNDDDFNPRGGFNGGWNPYRAYGGNNYSRNSDDNQSRAPFGGNYSQPRYDQFRENDSIFGFGGGGGGSGYSDFNRFMNNGPTISNNQFPSAYGYQQYGLNYGYTSSYNDYFNPYF